MTYVRFALANKNKENSIPITNGRFTILEETREIFLDVSDTERIKLTNYFELSNKLSLGSTSLILSDSNIKTDSTIEVFTNVYGVNPTLIIVDNGSVALEFEKQEKEVEVKIRVS